MSIDEAKVQGAEAILNVLFESLQQGYSLGRVVERFREVTRIEVQEGLYARIHQAGGLTINNLIFEEYERHTPGKQR